MAGTQTHSTSSFSSMRLVLSSAVFSVLVSVAFGQRPTTIAISEGSRDLVIPFNVQTLPRFANVNMTTRHQDIRISTRTKNIDMFRVDQRGNLVASEVIDLENMCSSTGFCCKSATITSNECGAADVSSCCIELWLFPPEAHTHEQLFVKLLDVNEFTPHFPNSVEEVQVYENQRSAISLPLPTDEDYSQRILYVHLRGPDANIFSERSPLRVDGSASRITLTLARELDREYRDTYRFSVLACEKERVEARCGVLNVTLSVLDMNDNPPRFNVSARPANLTVRETQSHETLIATLVAFDRDDAENAHINYQIDSEPKCASPGLGIGSGCWSSSEERQNERTVFEMRSGGELYAIGPLDYEECRKYSLVVRASNSAPSTYTDTIEVIINVLDVDDTRPCVRWVPGSRARIAENSAPGTELSSLVLVSDLDTPVNRITCDVQPSDDFRLKPVSAAGGAEFVRFLVVANRPFDREVSPTINVDVRCSDRIGAESLSSEWSTLELEVLDTNDNAPEFVTDDVGQSSSGSIYNRLITAEIDENAPAGTFIRKLVATDQDNFGNAEIEYTFANRTAYQYFNLDPVSGNLSSAILFDHETTSELRFVVLATDRGTPRNTGTATLIVHVNDVNDNAPEFTKPRYQFRVLENAQANFPVGTVAARDRDGKATITYRLLETQDHFLISSEKGDIVVYHPLDREALQSDRYTLTVIANDSVHTATAFVEIIVEDQNDREPRFVHPTAENSTIRFACPQANQCTGAPGCVITQVRTVDDDASSTNTLAAYSIKSSTHPDSFRINSATGDLYYRHDSSRGCFNTAKLTIEARDAQNPALVSALPITVVFLREERRVDGVASQSVPLYEGTLQSGENGETFEGGFISTQHLMIILVVSAAFVVCAVGLLLVLLARIRVRKASANDEDAEGAARHAGCQSNVADDAQSQLSSQAGELVRKDDTMEKIDEVEYCGTMSICGDNVMHELPSRRVSKDESAYFTNKGQQQQQQQQQQSLARGLVPRRPDRSLATTLTTPRLGLKSGPSSQPYIYYSITDGSARGPECESPTSHTTNSCFECSMQRNFPAQMKPTGISDEEHPYASAAEYDPACSCPDCVQVRLASQQCSLPVSLSQAPGSGFGALKSASVHVVPTINRYNLVKPMFNNHPQNRNNSSTCFVPVGDEVEKTLLIQRSDGYLTTIPRRTSDGNNNAEPLHGHGHGKSSSKTQHTAACPPDCQNPRCVVSYV